MEKCYKNNPQSLFKKYRHLVTWLANTQVGRDYLGLPKRKIGLFLPNGFHEISEESYQATFYTRPVFVKKLWPALCGVDAVQSWIKDFSEAQRLLAWQLGLTRNIPDLAKAIHLADTFYPDANTETTSVDGRAYHSTGANAAWSVLRDGAGTGASDTEANGRCIEVVAWNASNNWWQIGRGFFLFDTSSINDLATVTDAVFSPYILAADLNYNFSSGAISIALVTSAPASNTAIVAGDFDSAGTTQQSGNLAQGSISSNNYNDMTLNSTGRGNISLTGITKFATRDETDRSNTPMTWGSQQTCSAAFNFADNGSNKTKLVVTYTLPAKGAFLLNFI